MLEDLDEGNTDEYNFPGGRDRNVDGTSQDEDDDDDELTHEEGNDEKSEGPKKLRDDLSEIQVKVDYLEEFLEQLDYVE